MISRLSAGRNERAETEDERTERGGARSLRTKASATAEAARTGEGRPNTAHADAQF